MNSSNQLETINFTFHMTNVVRQKDGKFKDILSLMINGTLMIDNCRYLMNRCLSKIDKVKNNIFDEAIHLVTQWKHGIDSITKSLNM